MKRVVLDLKFLRKILDYTGLDNFVSGEGKKGKKVKFTKFVSLIRVFFLNLSYLSKEI